ncbi:hypothetical protein VP01_4018g2 [Puccinia sorghi]|uniref:Uncharacterized protein n=1 Tax=Puccinia sorghi TaxID=27349 RepID=A0A0L6URT6_9BASI|nr:hypothetical protein VP01_4018g2 [Puccinia sorghi]
MWLNNGTLFKPEAEICGNPWIIVDLVIFDPYCNCLFLLWLMSLKYASLWGTGLILSIADTIDYKIHHCETIVIKWRWGNGKGASRTQSRGRCLDTGCTHSFSNSSHFRFIFIGCYHSKPSYCARSIIEFINVSLGVRCQRCLFSTAGCLFHALGIGYSDITFHLSYFFLPALRPSTRFPRAKHRERVSGFAWLRLSQPDISRLRPNPRGIYTDIIELTNTYRCTFRRSSWVRKSNQANQEISVLINIHLVFSSQSSNQHKEVRSIILLEEMLHRGFPLAVLLLVSLNPFHMAIANSLQSEIFEAHDFMSPLSSARAQSSKPTWFSKIAIKITRSENTLPSESHLPVLASSAGETATDPHVTEDEAPLAHREPPPTAHASGPGSSAEEVPQDDFHTVSEPSSPSEQGHAAGISLREEGDTHDPQYQEALRISEQEALIQEDATLAQAFHDSLMKTNRVSADQPERHSPEDLQYLETLPPSEHEALAQDEAAFAKATQKSLGKAYRDPTPQHQPISSHISPDGPLANPSEPRPSRGVRQYHQGPPAQSFPTRDPDDELRRSVNRLVYGDQSNHERLPDPWIIRIVYHLFSISFWPPTWYWRSDCQPSILGVVSPKTPASGSHLGVGSLIFTCVRFDFYPFSFMSLDFDHHVSSPFLHCSST